MPVLIPLASPTTVEWLTWAERLQLDLKECPTILIADAIREEAIRFYRDSRAWRATGVALATTVAGQSEYTVTAIPAGAALAGLPFVWAGTKEVKESVPGDEDDYKPGKTGDVERVGVTAPSEITVYPVPVSSGVAISGTVAYRPGDESTGLSRDLYIAHRDTIECATLATMMMQPGKPWSNPQLADYYSGKASAHGLHDATKAGPRRRNTLRVQPV